MFSTSYSADIVAQASSEPEGAPGQSKSGDGLPVWLALAVVLHGLVYTFIVPPWMGEDEPWHMEYVRALTLSSGSQLVVPLEETGEEPEGIYLSQSQNEVQVTTGISPSQVLKSQAEITTSMQAHHFWERVDFAGWEHGSDTLDQAVFNHVETYQPSLYYRLCATALQLLKIRDVELQLWFLRGLSLISYFGIVLITYKIGRLLHPEQGLAVAAALIVAWLPMHVRQAAVINNDVGARIFAAGALWYTSLFVLERGGARSVLAMFLFAGLALATKASAVGILAPIAFGVVHYYARGRGPARYALITLGATVGCLLFAVIYWLIVSPGEWTGLESLVPIGMSDLPYHFSRVFSRYFFLEFLRTSVGTFNWYTRNLSMGLYLGVALVLALGLLGSLVATVKSKSSLQRKVLLVCWLAVLCQLFAMGARGFAAGRFFFSVLPAFGVLVAAGWTVPFPPAWRDRMVLLVATGMILLDGFVLWNGLFPHQYLEWGS